MKKHIVILLLLSCIIGQAQARFGQPSSEVLFSLTYSLETRPNWSLEKIYSQGEIVEIILYQENQIFYDLLIKVDAVQRFKFNNGLYEKNILQFPALRLTELRSKFDAHYKEKKIDRFYFTEDYSSFRTIEQIDNIASIVHQPINNYNLPTEIQNRISDIQQPSKVESTQNTLTDEVVEPYINPLEKFLIGNFEKCGGPNTLEVPMIQFDESYSANYLSYSQRKLYCKGDKDIRLDFLREEGIYGLYYFTFSDFSFDAVIQMLLESYDLPFDLSNLKSQSIIAEEDNKLHHTMETTFENGLKKIIIKSYYDDNPDGDYIKIEKNPDTSIQVHISYNGVI